MCVDAISSIGSVPVDLSRVYLASGVSGKGLGSYCGLAMVYADHEIASSPRVPRYLDLGLYGSSVPFTQSSNLVAALVCALGRFLDGGSARLSEVREHSRVLADMLAEGLPPKVTLLRPSRASPAVFTFRVEPCDAAGLLGERLLAGGFQVAFRAEYLRKRGWVQAFVMGSTSIADLTRFANLILAVAKGLPRFAEVS